MNVHTAFFLPHTYCVYRYGDQQMVIYNVQCPDNHIAYFNLTESDIESPTCVGYVHACMHYARFLVYVSLSFDTVPIV